MPKKTIKTPHDRFINGAFREKRVAKEFLQQYLPASVQKLIDWRSLHPSSTRYVSEDLSETQSDIVYQVKVAGKDAYILVAIEHQKNPERLMPLRIWRYLLEIMHTHAKTGPKVEKPLPLVLAMLVYNGKKAYPYTTNFWELIDAPQSLIADRLLNSIPLVDLSQIDDDELRSQKWAGLVQWLMKHVDNRHRLALIREWAYQLFEEIEGQQAFYYLDVCLSYVMETCSERERAAFFEVIGERLSKTMGERAMTIAEALKAEGVDIGLMRGRAEGIAEGKAEGKAELSKEIARKLLLKGASVADVQELTDLPVDEIEAIRRLVYH
jgi:predicted transposase/invertase (TIGR01784 family)